MIIRTIYIKFRGIPIETGESVSLEESTTLINNIEKKKKKNSEEEEDNSIDDIDTRKQSKTEQKGIEPQELERMLKSFKKIEGDKRSSFLIDVEQIPGKGEDGPPILLQFEDNSIVVGVADGMGGAGGTVYEIDDTKRSGAYLASHLVTSIAEKYFIHFKEEGHSITHPIQAKIAEELKYHFNQGIQQILNKIDKKGNVKLNIKSKMIKRLPTTLALGYIESDEKEFNVYTFWAGDSRIYSLDSFHGLHQLTEDNLVNETDAFDNLTNDSKISNCINADSDYTINVKGYKFNSPQIILATTDGAFGYLPTPVHFEHLLLDTLIHSTSIEDWKDNLRVHFKSGQSDDISLSLATVGYKDFVSLKNSFKERFLTLDEDVSKLNNLFQEMGAIEGSLVEINGRNEAIESRIDEYESQIHNSLKREKYLNNEINHYKSEISGSENSIADKMKEIDCLRKEIDKFLDQIKKMLIELGEVRKESEHLNNEFIQFKKQNTIKDAEALRNKIHSMKETRSKLNRDLWLKYKSHYEKYLKSSK